MRMFVRTAVAVSALLGFLAQALAQVPEIKLARQFSMGYLQLNVMEHQKLIEKHAKALGLADDPGTLAYLAAREQDRAVLLAELPRLWEKVAGATYRRRLFEMIVKL